MPEVRDKSQKVGQRELVALATCKHVLHVPTVEFAPDHAADSNRDLVDLATCKHMSHAPPMEYAVDNVADIVQDREDVIHNLRRIMANRSPKEILQGRRSNRQASKEAPALRKDHEKERLHRRLFQMGEANDWAAEMGLQTKFCIHRCSDDTLECHVYEDSANPVQISLDLFDKRYTTLRNQFQHCKLRGQLRRPDSNVESTMKPWLTDEQQQHRQNEIRAKTKAMKALASSLRKQYESLLVAQPPLTPFVVVG